jgi:solute carrier family 25 phosphate transporter 23/24/25/41
MDKIDSKKSTSSMEIYISLIAGATAGSISRTLTAPFDRLKTLMQMGRGVPLRPPGISKKELKKKRFQYGLDGQLLQACQSIYHESGIRGFWRGNGINILKVIPDEGLKYMCKRKITHAISGNSDHATLLQHILSGSLSGVASQSIIYPLEIIKTRMTVATTNEFKGIANCFYYTFRHGGLKAFYKGFTPNIAGIIPFQGVYFGLFFYLTDNYKSKHKCKRACTTRIFAYSIVSSILAVIISYPFNLVRTKLQTQGVNGRAQLYTGTINCLKLTVKHEGFSGLYRGLFPSFLKSLPSLTISLVLIDYISRTLTDVLVPTVDTVCPVIENT